MEQQPKRVSHFAFAELEDLNALQQRCLGEGICVHGCGPLTVDDSRNRHCPVCGFKHFAFPTHEKPGPPVDWDAPGYSNGQPDYEG